MARRTDDDDDDAPWLREADSPPEGRHFSQYYRWEGYQAAMTAAGLKPRFIGGILGEALDFSRAWLQHRDRPTAVVLYSVDILIPIVLAMAHQGLHPGRDLSLIAFSSESWFGRMNLDVMLLPGRGLGAAAAEMLLGKISSPKRMPSREIAMTYASGAMVGPPPVR